MWGDKQCGRCGAKVSTADQTGDACPRCGAPWNHEKTTSGQGSRFGASSGGGEAGRARARRALAWTMAILGLVGGTILYLRNKEKPHLQQATERTQEIERRAEQMERRAERIQREKQRKAESAQAETAPAAASIGDRGVRAAMGPEIVAGPAEVRGALDKQIIDRIVRRHINEVKYCYELESTKKTDLAGRISVQLTIAASGQVIASVLQSSTVGNLRVENCVVQAARRWMFPHPPGGGLVIVSYPFSFQPGV
jgi:TonB family protein